MKPLDYEFRFSGEQIREITDKLIIDMKPLITDILMECVKDVKWICRI